MGKLLRCPNPTPWHYFVELSIIVSGVAAVLTHMFYRHSIFAVIPHIWLSISVIVYYYLQVHVDALLTLLKSYRSIIVIFATIVNLGCDIASQLLSLRDSFGNWFVLVVNDITFVNAVITVLFIDCVPNITNISRFLFPVSLITVSAYNMYLSYFIWNDHIIFTYQQGSVSIGEIQRAALAQIILYCATSCFRVFIDKKHKKFTMLTSKISRKSLFKQKLQVQPFHYNKVGLCCFYVNMSCYYLMILIFGSTVLLMYIAQIQSPFVTGPFVVLLILLVINVLHQEFDTNICLKMLTQFRCLLLMLSIIISIYVTIQKFIWNAYIINDVFDIAEIILYVIAYNCTILLCLLHDGMKQTYPLYFNVLLCVLLAFVATYNVFFEEFNIDNVDNNLPSWFIELEKEGFYQVIFVMLLILISAYYDRYHVYFVLIVRKRFRKVFFYRSKRFSIPTWMIYYGFLNNDKTHISVPHSSGSNKLFYRTTAMIQNDINDDFLDEDGHNNYKFTLTETASTVDRIRNQNTDTNTPITPTHTLELSSTSKGFNKKYGSMDPNK